MLLIWKENSDTVIDITGDVNGNNLLHISDLEENDVAIKAEDADTINNTFLTILGNKWRS